MLSSIPFPKDFSSLIAEYKKFKLNIFNKWCEYDHHSLDSEEKKLIDAINLILEKIKEENNEEIKEENIMRVLIGARILSKYSLTNQDICVGFFDQISQNFPKSIQNKKFFFKCIAKECKKNSSSDWDKFIIYIYKRILQKENQHLEESDFIENSLIYIDFLYQFAPDFLSKFSEEIILHLLKIIEDEKNDCTLDLNFVMLSRIEQTSDQYYLSNNKYYSNIAIEILRKILLNIKPIRYQLIFDNFKQKLSKDPEKILKSLAIICVFLEPREKEFLDQNISYIKNFVNINEDSFTEQIQLLRARILIYCLQSDEKPDEKLFNYLFSFDDELNESIICEKLQNLKLLIFHNHTKEIKDEFSKTAIKFIANPKKTIQDNAFDLLNTFCLFSDTNETKFVFDPKYKDQIFNNINFKFNELVKLMLTDKSLFINSLSNFIQNYPLESLQYLDDNVVIRDDDDDDDDDDGLSNKKDTNDLGQAFQILKSTECNELKQKIIEPIYNHINNNDYQIRSLVPLVVLQISEPYFLTHLEELINLLLTDSSDQVRLAIVQSFNSLLALSNDKSFTQILNDFLEYDKYENIIKILLNENAPYDLRIETIKFICEAKRRNISTDPTNINDLFKIFTEDGYQMDYEIIPRKFANVTQYLPYYIEAFPGIYQNQFQLFYNFIFDIMNIITAKDDDDYQNRSKIQYKVKTKTLFQSKFYDEIFCSLSKVLQIILKNNSKYIEPFIEEIVRFSISRLYHGLTEPETESTLILLKKCLHHIGIDETLKINDQFLFKGTNLYSIVLNSFSHFISQSISTQIYKILSFIGEQEYIENFNELESQDSWKSELKYKSYDMSKPLTRSKITYMNCSEPLFEILEDKSKSNSHFTVLKSLISIQLQKDIRPMYMKSEFNRTFEIFQEMLNHSSKDKKKDFVSLLQILINFNIETIKDSIPNMVKCFIDLWSSDSSSSVLLTDFVSKLKTGLSPYLNQIIPLIQNSENSVDLLILLYKGCVRFLGSDKIFFFDIVTILIQMIEEGHYEALKGLIELIPMLPNLHEYIPSIVDVCVQNIEYAIPASQRGGSGSNSNTNDNDNNNNHDDDDDDDDDEILDEEYFKDTINVINSLIENSKKSENVNRIFNESKQPILDVLAHFPHELNKVNEKIGEMNDKGVQPSNNSNLFKNNEIDPLPVKERFKMKINLPFESDSDLLFMQDNDLEFDKNEFIKNFTKIHNLIDRNVEPYFVQLQINDFILYCIRESPSLIIRKVFPVAKDNFKYALSVFNIAFYSCIIKFMPNKFTNNNRNNNAMRINLKTTQNQRNQNRNPFDRRNTTQPNANQQQQQQQRTNITNQNTPKAPSKMKLFRKEIKDITLTFISILKMKELSSQHKTIIINLIEYLDRANAPVLSAESISMLDSNLTSVFSSNPPLALQFCLRYYSFRTKEKIEKLKREAAADLEQAFLNAGLVSQYQHFARITRGHTNNINNNNNNNNNNDDDDDDDDTNIRLNDVYDNSSFLLPIYPDTNERTKHLQEANIFFLDKKWDDFNKQIELCDRKIVSHLFKTASMIKRYWENHPKEETDPKSIQPDYIYNYIDYIDDKQKGTDTTNSKLEILKEISKGFRSLGEEGRASFTREKRSISQQIIYSQQLTELQEMFFSNCQLNNYILRFNKSDDLSSFRHHVLLLRIAAKGNIKDSLPEKIELLSICRKSKKWDLMNKYYNHFFGTETTNIPVEISYEMIYNKLENNQIQNVEEFDQLIEKINDLKSSKKKIISSTFDKEYEYSNLEKLVKYQKAIFYVHSSRLRKNFQNAIDLCKDFENADAINLLSWANLSLFNILYKKANRSDLTFRKEVDYKYLFEAIKGYIKSSIMSDKMRIPNMITIISLLFNHFKGKPIINEMEKELNKIPLHFYIKPIPLVISYIHEIRDDEFGKFIIDLLIKIMEEYPRGVIYDYSFSIFCDKRIGENNTIINSPIEKVKEYFELKPERLIAKNCSKIFREVTELTNNLYLVSSHIRTIVLNYSKYAFSFIEKEISINPNKKIEFEGFERDSIKINNDYFIPLHNYIQLKKDSNFNAVGSVYQPNATEKIEIDDLDLKKVFNNIHKLINKSIEEITELRELRKKLNQLNDNLMSLEREKIALELKKTATKSDTLNNQDIENDIAFLTSSGAGRQNDLYDDCNISTDFMITSVQYKKDKRVNLLMNDKSSKPTLINKKPETIKKEKLRRQSDKIAEDIEKIRNDISDLKKKINDKIKKEKDNFTIQKDPIDNYNCYDCYKKFFDYYCKLTKLKPKSKIQHDMLIESPKMREMVDLSLPVFGTFNYTDENPVLIHSFVNKYSSLPSNASPKHIEIIGSDGNKYPFILKASEDLRVDQRNMIFFDFLNDFLKTKIRTYSVTPLTTKFGVIQFVKNTSSLRDMVEANRIKAEVKSKEENFVVKMFEKMDSYNRNYSWFSSIKNYNTLNRIQRYEVFSKIVEEFSNRKFDLKNSLWISAPDSETWVKYIVNFNKTCAVTSIVGYIIGIGDRHLNNIMISLTDGGLVHIDFADCFEVDQIRENSPERVPFRLTRNLIEAFGPCGVNGTFRSTCEETLALIRENREMIYNILEVFIISPIQDYGIARDLARSDDEIKFIQTTNNYKMQRIQQKLNGTDRKIIMDENIIKKKYCSKIKKNDNEKPVSVHEQVDRLIKHASSDYFISASYVGWKPWI